MPSRRPTPQPQGPSYHAPVNNTYVTQRQLKETSDALDAKITKNREEIGTISTGLKTLSTDLTRQTVALKKEAEARKKDVSGLRNNVQLAALLPLLIRPKTKDVTGSVENTTLASGDKVLVDQGDS